MFLKNIYLHFSIYVNLLFALRVHCCAKCIQIFDFSKSDLGYFQFFCWKELLLLINVITICLKYAVVLYVYVFQCLIILRFTIFYIIIPYTYTARNSVKNFFDSLTHTICLWLITGPISTMHFNKFATFATKNLFDI